MRLPSLMALQAFHAAADSGSFKQAAERLFVTQAAISQHIRALEAQAGQPLFTRQHRKVTLTPAGEQLYHYTSTAFSALVSGWQAIQPEQQSRTITLSVLPSFASLWLVKRLGRFSEQHPDIEILLQPSLALVDFSQSQVDLCIRFGSGQYPGLRSHFLMPDRLYPVCHPGFLETHPVASPEDLPCCTLLEETLPDMRWNRWFSALGLTPRIKTAALRYEGSNYVVDAALAGQGIALVRHTLVKDLVGMGALRRPFEATVQAEYNYYLVAPDHQFRRPAIQVFCEWLCGEAQAFYADEPDQDVGQWPPLMTVPD
ncbi:MAG: LysR family transcriptional regulator [Gammaproteobacteria bacterium]|nr:MAG: LysR family transcriptional regulator [Gammaproteobacteria bacterium]